MGYLNRVWMAASVATVNGHSDQGHRWQTGLRTIQSGKKIFSSAADSPDLRPLSGAVAAGHAGGSGGAPAGDERRKHTDDSLRQVMYLSCWGQS